MAGFDPLAVYDKCPICGSSNYHWKANVRIEMGNLVVTCLKCLITFITSESHFLKRAAKQEPREPGQEG